MKLHCSWSAGLGRSLLAMGLLAVLGRAEGQDSADIFLKGPYLQGPGTTRMTIKWEATINEPSVLHYGLEGKQDRSLQVGSPHLIRVPLTTAVTNVNSAGETKITRTSTTNVFYLYEVDLTELQPGAAYTYSAETGGHRSPARVFRTFSREQAKTTLIAYGDARSNPKIHAQVASNFKRYSPDFILHTGDLVADGRRYELWGREFFGPLNHVIDEVPMLPSIGNHEQDGSNYLFYLQLPTEQRWYSYDVGPVHVVALDYRLEKGNDEQFAFAKQDLLGSKAPWKIVFMHYPVFNIGGHATRWGHQAYLPLFHEAKVDLVVVGHSHIYERFRPVAAAEGKDSWPITHLTTGGGGAGLASVLPHPALASFYSTNHFVVIEATATSLKGQTFNANNELIDKFGWTKENGQPSAEYRAEVYPEEALKLTFDAVTSLTASLASAPRKDASAPAMFTLHPLKGRAQPVEMEIELTPASARYYRLEHGPVHVVAPSESESEKIVWADVKAVEDGPSSGSGSSALSHALVFQGRLKANGVETWAYGQRCGISETAATAAASRKKNGS